MSKILIRLQKSDAIKGKKLSLPDDICQKKYCTWDGYKVPLGRDKITTKVVTLKQGCSKGEEKVQKEYDYFDSGMDWAEKIDKECGR